MTTANSSPPAREQVYEAFADRSRSFSDAVTTALSAGCDRLGLSVGFLTEITDGTQYVEEAVGGHPEIRQGAECPLSEAYCRRTVELDGQLSVQDAAASPEIADAAYDRFGLGSYLGSRVVVNGDVYGTVCFADEAQRNEPFTEAEELFAELVARLVGRAIERRAYERERAEQTARLAAEKRRFEGIAENSFDVLFRIDTEGRFTYVSDAARRILGYDPDTLVGDAFADYLIQTTAADALDTFDGLLSGDPVQGLELSFEHRDGSEVVVEVNATPITDDGTVTAVQGVGRDITERREREQELRVRTRAMDEAEVPITIADASEPDNPIIYANDAFEAVTGYSQAEITSQNCRILQGPDTDPEETAQLREGIEEDRPVTTELLNYRRDGSPFWNRVTITPVQNDDGEITHYLGFQQDVTDGKRSERLIGLLNRVLRHNLRNELTVIQGYTEFIDDPPPDTDIAASIRRPLDRLLDLSETARELETYARQERYPVRLDPAAFLPTVAASLRSAHPSATVSVTVETDRDICAGEELQRAVEELLTNALEHDPNPETTVEITARDQGEWVEIEVRDDGPGIPSMEARVVETGEETKLQHGKGLGLWLVNWTATRYGGSFQIAGGDGTVATLRLPAITDDQSVEAVARRPTVLFR
ncbi:PAS domain S-box protein [Halomicroarcula sp. GCM10025709]|uniref:PAS domain S-box protein n=1 Tax=Haloarcula TaxID=2237 RepID=UPI0024C34E8F|nr:PAS domain S-box protein [Halomicroarcula sp. YJ-61-S]